MMIEMQTIEGGLKSRRTSGDHIKKVNQYKQSRENQEKFFKTKYSIEGALNAITCLATSVVSPDKTSIANSNCTTNKTGLRPISRPW